VFSESVCTVQMHLFFYTHQPPQTQSLYFNNCIPNLQGNIERRGISKIPKITTYHNYTQYTLYLISPRKNKVAFIFTKGRLKKNNVWLEQGPVLIFNFNVIQYILFLTWAVDVYVKLLGAILQMYINLTFLCERKWSCSYEYNVCIHIRFYSFLLLVPDNVPLNPINICYMFENNKTM